MPKTRKLNFILATTVDHFRFSSYAHFYVKPSDPLENLDFRSSETKILDGVSFIKKCRKMEKECVTQKTENLKNRKAARKRNLLIRFLL
jgi:hypothetical protein